MSTGAGSVPTKPTNRIFNKMPRQCRHHDTANNDDEIVEAMIAVQFCQKPCRQNNDRVVPEINGIRAHPQPTQWADA